MSAHHEVSFTVTGVRTLEDAEVVARETLARYDVGNGFKWRIRTSASASFATIKGEIKLWDVEVYAIRVGS